MLLTLMAGSRNGARRWFPLVKWILAGQLAAALLPALLVTPFCGVACGGSLGLGGMLAFMPALLFAHQAGRREDRRTARQVVRSFYGGELLKLLLTAGMFALVAQIPGLRWMPLFVGYGLVLSVYWFALLVRRPQS